jgi:hypothetical protein
MSNINLIYKSPINLVIENNDSNYGLPTTVLKVYISCKDYKIDIYESIYFKYKHK